MKLKNDVIYRHAILAFDGKTCNPFIYNNIFTVTTLLSLYRQLLPSITVKNNVVHVKTLWLQGFVTVNRQDSSPQRL